MSEANTTRSPLVNMYSPRQLTIYPSVQPNIATPVQANNTIPVQANIAVYPSVPQKIKTAVQPNIAVYPSVQQKLPTSVPQKIKTAVQPRVRTTAGYGASHTFQSGDDCKLYLPVRLGSYETVSLEEVGLARPDSYFMLFLPNRHIERVVGCNVTGSNFCLRTTTTLINCGIRVLAGTTEYITDINEVKPDPKLTNLIWLSLRFLEPVVLEKELAVTAYIAINDIQTLNLIKGLQTNTLLFKRVSEPLTKVPDSNLVLKLTWKTDPKKPNFDGSLRQRPPSLQAMSVATELYRIGTVEFFLHLRKDWFTFYSPKVTVTIQPKHTILYHIDKANPICLLTIDGVVEIRLVYKDSKSYFAFQSPTGLINSELTVLGMIEFKKFASLGRKDLPTHLAHTAAKISPSLLLIKLMILPDSKICWKLYNYSDIAIGIITNEQTKFLGYYNTLHYLHSQTRKLFTLEIIKDGTDPASGETI